MEKEIIQLLKSEGVGKSTIAFNSKSYQEVYGIYVYRNKVCCLKGGWDIDFDSLDTKEQKAILTLVQSKDWEIIKEKKKIFVYGASTRGNTLLQYCGLNDKLIEKAVERNFEKWGRKISSVGIPIISEEQARKERPDYMLILPWFFKKELSR